MGLAFWSADTNLDKSSFAQDFILNRYISSGNGSGNPYGVAAVAAVVFPMLSFARIYAPGPPMTYVIYSMFESNITFITQDCYIFHHNCLGLSITRPTCQKILTLCTDRGIFVARHAFPDSL